MVLFILACGTDNTLQPLETGEVLDTPEVVDSFDTEDPWAEDPWEADLLIDQEDLPEPNSWYDADGWEHTAIPLGTSSAFGAWAQLRGENTNDYVGLGMNVVGDVNGNGKSDLVVGSQANSGDGTAYLVTRIQPGVKNLGSSKGRFYGTNGENAGYSTGAGGDLDGDGLDDWVIGSQKDNTNGTKTGAVHLITGYARGKNTLPSGTTASIYGLEEYANFGKQVDIVGDVTGNGELDILVGAPYDDALGADRGVVYVFEGGMSGDYDTNDRYARIGGRFEGDQLGKNFRDIGDIDGDGEDDILFGVRDHSAGGAGAGAVFLMTSIPSGSYTLANADARIKGTNEDDAVGNSIAPAGDFDGDGYDDFLVGSLGKGDRGAAYLVLGPISGEHTIENAYTYKFSGQNSGDQFGSGLMAYDVDGSGDPDVVIGANRQGSNDRGAVYVFLDPTVGTTPAYAADSKIVGMSGGDYFGGGIQMIENIDQSGTDVMAVGSTRRGSNDKGAVFLFSVNP